MCTNIMLSVPDVLCRVSILNFVTDLEFHEIIIQQKKTHTQQIIIGMATKRSNMQMTIERKVENQQIHSWFGCADGWYLGHMLNTMRNPLHSLLPHASQVRWLAGGDLSRT